MTAEPRGVDRAALRTEARSLEFLLRSYLADQEFLNSSDGAILYFVDAHELKPYLKPDESEHLQGFIFEAERALYASSMPQFEFEMKLRSDQILHSLLFNPRLDVGLLPSHCDEVDEELAFHAGAAFRKQIKLLERARDEVRRLRNQEAPRKLIARLNNPDDKTAKRDLVAFFAKEAPSLMVVLRGSPDNTRARLEALGDRSNLVRIQDFDWKKLGFDEATCSRLENLWPSAERMEGWRQFLAGRKERQRNSFRANRIDGEAIAYLQTLNQVFAESKKPRVVARLVTRTMTLINSVMDVKPNSTIGEADFIRHPRLLARSAAQERAGDAERELMVALRTYRRQLDTLRQVQDDDERQSAPVKALVEAWHDFERARVTIELHAQAENLGPKDEAGIGDPVVQQLLHWFGAADVADLVNDELRKAVSRFVRATVALEKDVTAPISARVKAQSHSKRIRLIPIIAGAPGPVEFDADALPELRTTSDLLSVFERMDTASMERYIGWALLFACQKRQKHVEDRHTDRKWELADIYARGAIAIGDLHHGAPRARAAGHADEAYLLLAQIQRLGARPAHNLSTDTTPALQRYKSAMGFLDKFKRSNDPRWARERAAQILELRLEVGPQSELEGSDIASGIEWIHRALEWAAGDTVLLPRILELGLTYHLAASRYRDIWPGRTSADIAVARGWHERLQAVLQQQRSEAPREEISRRALAMEIIGFRLLRTPGGGSGEASESILAFARDLRAEIGPSTDKSAQLIKLALDSVSRSERDLVSAPIWGSHPTEWIIELADDPRVAELMTSGYANLTRIAGGSQKAAVTSLDTHVLEDIARDFTQASRVLEKRASQGEERAQEARFYTRMEVCYANLLLALIDENERDAKLERLIAEYEAISCDYPKASIPHFRLDSI
jgi:hypothetical protein